MTKIVWDAEGEKKYRLGLDRGVLYSLANTGVPWNGLISVDEKPVGGEVTPSYMDGVKYFNEILLEEFSATLSAYTYPEELEQVLGLDPDRSGVSFGEQDRSSCFLSYRSWSGDDVDGQLSSYKLHLIYDALFTPTAKKYTTLSGSPAPDVMTWDLTVSPRQVSGRKPTSHFVVDSSIVRREDLDRLESILYGTASTRPRMPTITEFLDIFDSWPNLEIKSNTVTGVSPLRYHGLPDLKGDTNRGFYTLPEGTRLTVSSVDGIYNLPA